MKAEFVLHRAQEVWVCVIAKRDLYPKFRRQTRHGLHLETDVSHKPVAEPVEEVICNFARIEVKEPEIINQASQKLNLKHGLSHLGLGLIIRDPDSIRDPLRICSENRISGVPGSESG